MPPGLTTQISVGQMPVVRATDCGPEYKSDLHWRLAHIYIWGRRVIGISRSLIWSKTLMELIFNPCGENR